jgi:hypothetical protein
MRRVDGFARVDGQQIVNGKGEPLLLRGVGLGNWLLPEGYMWRFRSTGADRPRRIEALIRELAGSDYAESFWPKYRDRYITERDIQEIQRLGFNSVRVPVNARVIWNEGTIDQYREENLGLIDRLVDWCAHYGLYVILDLHGAPGGQTGANIDDSAHDFPELFRDAASRAATIALWKMLAERYRESETVLGYDLLNEPLAPPFRDQFLWDLENLQRELTGAIREVDQRHIIIVEGAVWSTDWTTFTERYDDNLVFQFHKYWSPPDTHSIQQYLDKRQALEAPIWMGEGGENHPDWLFACFQLYEDHNIGWNFWPWKKMETLTSPYSIRRPEEWDAIVAYVEQKVIPSPDVARRAFDEYLENMRIERAEYRPQVINALFRRIDDTIQIPAVYIGHRGEGVSYHATVSNAHPFRTGDGPRIENLESNNLALPDYRASTGADRDQTLVLVLSQGEWVRYDVTAVEPMNLTVTAYVSGDPSESSLGVGVNADETLTTVNISGDWREVQLLSTPVVPGTVSVRVTCERGTGRLAWIRFQPEKP